MCKLRQCTCRLLIDHDQLVEHKKILIVILKTPLHRNSIALTPSPVWVVSDFSTLEIPHNFLPYFHYP